MRTHVVTAFVLCAVVLGVGVTTGAPPVRASGVTCREVAVPVALAAGQQPGATVRGTYCTPSGRADVDVLLAGATYTRDYWDWPTDPTRYSYLDRTLAAGRAALALDRIGSGTSSRPSGASLSMAVDAFTVHQVVSWLRTDPGVGRITLVGHSLGSGVAMIEEATYHDVDRLVLTGMLHAVGSRLAAALADFQPVVSLDAGMVGYLTTVAGTRGSIFYSSSADPTVVAYDEAHKDVVSGTEFGGYPDLLLPTAVDASRLVDAPVLLVAGQLDALLCGGTLDCTDAAAVRANEVPYFPAAPSVDTLTVPDTGHDLALHPSAGTSFAAIDAWIEAH